MSEPQQRRSRIPLLVGVICAVLAAAYVVYMFWVGRPKDVVKSAEAPIASEPIRIGTFSTAIDYAPLMVAQSKRWIQTELGISDKNIEFTTFQTLPAINEAFAAGKLDVVFEAEVPAIVGRAAGIDIRITGLGATLNEGILARADSRVRNLGDLKGKSVAVLSGTAMHYGLLNLLKSSGVDPSTVRLVNMIPPDAAAAFASGQVDAWAVWPPWPEQQVIAKTGRFLPSGAAAVQSVVVMRQGFIDRGAEAEKIARVVERAKNWLQQNESEGITLVAQQLKLPEDVVRLAWPKHQWSATLSPDISKDIESKATFLLNQKMIQNPVTAKELILHLGRVP